MKRLTMRNDRGMAFWRDLQSAGGGYRMTEEKKDQDRLDRLAAYEDTGLEPEEVTAIKHALMGRETAKITELDGIPVKRLRELAQVEKDGRLVVMQEGVTVRRLQGEYRKAKHMADERLPSPDYTAGRIAGFGAGVVHILDKILTREEAEAALKKREEEDNDS